MTTIKKTTHPPKNASVAILATDAASLDASFLTADERDYIITQNNTHQRSSFSFNKISHWIFIKIMPAGKADHLLLEACRKAGDEVQCEANKLQIAAVTLTGAGASATQLLAMAEGAVLGNYQFIKYFKKEADKKHTLATLYLADEQVDDEQIQLLQQATEAVGKARDLVNEPVNHLNATQLAQHFKAMADDAGIQAEVLKRKKIEALKMGGLLAVNAGSVDAPTFTILEYKPENPHNERPIILVGKGVTYDTGGLNIKTGKSMSDMKCDMSGAATMAAAVCLAAKAKLPLHLVALLPATDNRLNANAIVPGDIITMADGTTVEITNTDAEGRLLLADALSYAGRYNPLLVIDAATLTGSAVRALGRYGMAAMQAKADEALQQLTASGDQVYERVVTFPFWDEYGDLMKSDIADLKNSGPAEAGMITAGKFLQHFTNYPFIHLDIAGVAFAEKRDSYRGLGGTGTGIRLLFHFLQNFGTGGSFEGRG
jgi:leucyl aminopeptidase